MGRDVIIACDFNSKEEVINFLGKFQRGKTFCKNRHGAVLCRGTEIVRTIKQMGHKIFLDLKLHDIPNTVKKAMSVLSGLDVDMCNVHAGRYQGDDAGSHRGTHERRWNKTTADRSHTAYFHQ